MFELEAVSRAFVTLFVISDPIGTVPIFLALTAQYARHEQRTIVMWVVIFTFCVLTGVAIGGGAVLDALGIETPAFRISGGLFLFWTAFEMMFEKRQERRKKTISNTTSGLELRALAASPLVIPLVAGPGTITATILLADDMQGLEGRVVLIGVIAALTAVIAVVFTAAIPLSRFMNTTTRLLITRILGLLLGALAVQIIIDGIKSAF